MKKKIVITIIAFLLIGALLPIVTTGAEASLEQRALSLVSQQEGIPIGELTIADLVKKHYRMTGETFYLAKVLSISSGEVYGINLDESGNLFDAGVARDLEAVEQDTIQGRIHPDLYARLQEMDASATTVVAIWMKTPNFETPSRPTVSVGFGNDQIMDQDVSNELHTTAIDQLVDQMDAVQQPILDALSAEGVDTEYISPTTPLIYVELPVSGIYDMAARDDVDMIYGPNDNHDYMDIAKVTQGASVIDDLWGIDGSGVSVAILEDSRIEFDNPNLNAGVTRVPTDSNVDNHATSTAGMVASQNSTHQGIAQGSSLLSANATDYGDANLAAAMDWARTQGADVINNSWGSDNETGLNEHARHLDYIWRYGCNIVTVSAGNDGPSGVVGNPGRAYNVITVGAYDDQGTVTWADDVMASYSSFIDPGTGAEKPEVVASGSSITSTTASSPWVGNVGSGTSYSAPMVAGLGAMMVQANPNLGCWPESVKAIIMATALHNIESDTRLSDQDGAGGVDMRRAIRLSRSGPWDGEYLYEDDFPIVKNIYLRKGENVRAVLTWDSNPASDYSTDPLEADLDLYVHDPDGVFVTGSASGSNPFEIVEFTPVKAGMYQFTIGAYSYTGSSGEYVGFAVWTGDKKTTAGFDNDGDTDLSLYRPSTGGWYVKDQLSTAYGGAADDIPVPEDYDGDGTVDIAIYRPSTGYWYVKDQFAVQYGGMAGDIPVPADYDGDGDTDIAIYRSSWGSWLVKDQFAIAYGAPTDIPVPADYDGDGDADLGVYRPSFGGWYVKDQFALAYGGAADDIPLPFDYDGDGDADIAVYRPSTGYWYVKNQFAVQYGGMTGDTPVPGDYDGDGDTDVAIYRTAWGSWLVKDQFAIAYGASTDFPLAAKDTNGDGDPYQ